MDVQQLYYSVKTMFAVAMPVCTVSIKQSLAMLQALLES